MWHVRKGKGKGVEGREEWAKGSGRRMWHVRKVKGKQCSGQYSTLRKTGRCRFWSGGRVIHVDSRGATFQVGIKEENKIIQQVKCDKSEE